MKRKTAYTAALVILASSLGTLAGISLYRLLPRRLSLTAEERSWLREHDGKIVLGADPSYPPIDYVNSQGMHDGIAEDLLTLVEKRLGISIRRQVMKDWSAVLEGVQSGALDGILAVSRAEERDSYLILTEPYLEMPTVFAARSDDGSMRKPADLSGKQVCITEGYSSYAYFMRQRNIFKIVPAANEFEGLAAVTTGRADAAVSDLPVISFFIDKKRISGLKILGETGYVHRISFGVRKDRETLRVILDKALLSISPEEKKRIIEDWIDVEYRSPAYSAATWAIGALLLAAAATAVLLAGLWDRSLRRLVRARTRELNDYRVHLEELVEERTRELAETNRALAEAIRTLETLARTDTLTGCPNRRAFMELARREHDRALRRGLSYGLIEFDLDHFKLVNDTWGHAAGDRVLQAAVDAVTSVLRGEDLFARLGGEEFFVLLPDAKREETATTAERLRSLLEGLACPLEGRESLRFTASFGGTVFRGDDENLEQVMLRADMALYRAKDEGRNRVVID